MSRNCSRAPLALVLTLAAAALLAAPAAARTPLPQVTGPLPVSATSYPFGAAAHQAMPQDLARAGYVEEEYLVSGKANVYSWPAPGPAVVRTRDAPYTTRVLVRRPADRRRFSGNVVVEMLNPSNLFDLNIGWALMQRQFLRHGDVWVGITAKPITVAALKAFDPGRYGSLSFANPLPLSDPRNCTDIQTSVDPPALRSRSTEDGLIWDINSQVGAWLRSRAGSNPLTYGRRHGRVQHAACDQGPRSRFPSSIHFDAALRNLDLWVRYGLAPPHAEPIAVVNGAPLLDAFGNVIGGLRSPYVDVPTSRWLGSSTGASFCFIAGHEEPLPAATLRQLYPTHRAYVRAVVRDVRQLVRARFLTRADGWRLIREAAQANVPPG